MSKPSVALVVGTRPEAIKIAPLAHRLRGRDDIELQLCITGQHQEMLEQVLELFELPVAARLPVPQGSSLTRLTSEMMRELDGYFHETSPALVVVHGDTCTCFVASLAAFHLQLPVAHVEAGLRSGNRHSPWPEENYRRMADTLAELHLAPTPAARDTLLAEGLPASRIRVTGNTVVDALLWMKQRIDDHRWRPDHTSPLACLQPERRHVLITSHRRESHGNGLQSICRAVARLASRHTDVDFVFPVHLNPTVQQAVYGELKHYRNVILTAPLDYRHLVWLMMHAELILTDSGGIQEEAVTLGKPLLILRDTTERPEALANEGTRLVGTNPDAIYECAHNVLESRLELAPTDPSSSPYGDGQAARRIESFIVEWLAGRTRRPAS
ncbi:non-hydrolyzing UDP-N-acetylglucosamine 2-epimerase [Billgrantia aerodenitrificans]|uniref:UDP-N-acetylglucosamine 2-epimerase (non-hydrolyzing) n=1 Tax=Billgrantia aerodenitrificans TaxID=2733483 RepID=A0ABS9AT99_9GAMM|nr:UDP-N-acetylglucosamine 2-epimerase (non-hydrolyzing) [Halomonas aerodenitrificans]MCE8025009.1 UDP-N-acetylglucosamine 2-epimerase (non-hydrolyzing) [Halomonas aerodenitrificans]